MRPWYEVAAERALATEAKYGIALPVVDYEDGVERAFLGCDADLLCKWVLEENPTLNAFEVIIEKTGGGTVTVLFTGMTRDANRRYLERRMVIELEDDLTYYTEAVDFALASSEIVRDENDLVTIRTPRWTLRDRP